MAAGDITAVATGGAIIELKAADGSFYNVLLTAAQVEKMATALTSIANAQAAASTIPIIAL